MPRKKVLKQYLEMAQYKKTGVLKALVVCGCLAQRYHDEIKEEIPEVECIIGQQPMKISLTLLWKLFPDIFLKNLKI